MRYAEIIKQNMQESQDKQWIAEIVKAIIKSAKPEVYKRIDHYATQPNPARAMLADVTKLQMKALAQFKQVYRQGMANESMTEAQMEENVGVLVRVMQQAAKRYGPELLKMFGLSSAVVFIATLITMGIVGLVQLVNKNNKAYQKRNKVKFWSFAKNLTKAAFGIVVMLFIYFLAIFILSVAMETINNYFQELRRERDRGAEEVQISQLYRNHPDIPRYDDSNVQASLDYHTRYIQQYRGLLYRAREAGVDDRTVARIRDEYAGSSIVNIHNALVSEIQLAADRRDTTAQTDEIRRISPRLLAVIPTPAREQDRPRHYRIIAHGIRMAMAGGAQLNSIIIAIANAGDDADDIVNALYELVPEGSRPQRLGDPDEEDEDDEWMDDEPAPSPSLARSGAATKPMADRPKLSPSDGAFNTEKNWALIYQQNKEEIPQILEEWLIRELGVVSEGAANIIEQYIQESGAITLKRRLEGTSDGIEDASIGVRSITKNTYMGSLGVYAINMKFEYALTSNSGRVVISAKEGRRQPEQVSANQALAYMDFQQRAFFRSYLAEHMERCGKSMDDAHNDHFQKEYIDSRNRRAANVIRESLGMSLEERQFIEEYQYNQGLEKIVKRLQGEDPRTAVKRLDDLSRSYVKGRAQDALIKFVKKHGTRALEVLKRVPAKYWGVVIVAGLAMSVIYVPKLLQLVYRRMRGR